MDCNSFDLSPSKKDPIHKPFLVINVMHAATYFEVGGKKMVSNWEFRGSCSNETQNLFQKKHVCDPICKNRCITHIATKIVTSDTFEKLKETLTEPGKPLKEQGSLTTWQKRWVKLQNFRNTPRSEFHYELSIMRILINGSWCPLNAAHLSWNRYALYSSAATNSQNPISSVVNLNLKDTQKKRRSRTSPRQWN